LRNLVKVLKVKEDTDFAEDGEKLGDNWLLAELGNGGDGFEYFIVTNGIGADEMPQLLAPDILATFVADQVNNLWKNR